MSRMNSKSHRKSLLFWGWGYAEDKLSDEENCHIDHIVKTLVPEGTVELKPPQID